MSASAELPVVETRRPSIGSRALGAFCVAYALSVLVPWSPRTTSGEFDPSWVEFLNSTFLSGLQFGDDIAFTLGPWGFLYPCFYHPGTFPALLLGWIALSSALAWLSWRIARRGAARAAIAAAWTVALVTLAGASRDAFFLALPLLAVADRSGAPEGEGPFPAVATAAVLALAALVKFTFFIPAVLAAVAIGAIEARARRVPRTPIAFTLAMALLWVLAAQSPSGFPSYVVGSIEVARGYTDAVGIEWRPLEIATYLVAAAGVMGVAVDASRAAPRARRLASLTVLAAVLFMAFKHAFVRADGHVVTGASVLAIAACLHAPLAWASATGSARRAFAAAVLTLSLAAGAWIFSCAVGESLAGSLVACATSAPGGARTALRLLTDGAAEPARARAAALASIRAAAPVPPITGTVDVYPWAITVPIAHGLELRPRPTVQSLTAFTGALAERNAAHLRGPRAADTILFDLGTMDERFPSLDDGLSWPELLTRYDVASSSGPFLVLRRSPLPRAYRLAPIGEAAARFDEPIPLPVGEEGPIWATIEMRPTPLRGAALFLLRAPNVAMTVRTVDGHEERYRLVPSLAAAGFLLSPVVRHRDGFASLAAGERGTDDEDARVDSIRISSPRRPWFFEPTIAVRFSRLEFPAQDLARDASYQAKRRVLEALHALKRGSEGPVIPSGLVLITIEDAPALLAHAPSRLRVPVDAAAHALRIGFGIRPGAWSDGGGTDGVTFRVSLRLPGGEERLLWSRALDPVRSPADRGTQRAEIDVPGAEGGALILETLGGPSTAWDWSYWLAPEPR